MMDVRIGVCEDGKWVELAQDCAQWQALSLAVVTV
jgi:hypothetical protein